MNTDRTLGRWYIGMLQKHTICVYIYIYIYVCRRVYMCVGVYTYITYKPISILDNVSLVIIACVIEGA